MKTRIIHELTQRVRIKLNHGNLNGFDIDPLKKKLLKKKGIDKVQFSTTTNNILIHFDGNLDVKNAIFDIIKEHTPTTWVSEKTAKIKEKGPSGMDLIVNGSLILASPFLPWNLRNVLAMGAVMPKMRSGVRTLGQKRMNKDVIDAVALGGAMGKGGVGMAGKISYLMLLRDYVRQ